MVESRIQAEDKILALSALRESRGTPFRLFIFQSSLNVDDEIDFHKCSPGETAPANVFWVCNHLLVGNAK